MNPKLEQTQINLIRSVLEMGDVWRGGQECAQKANNTREQNKRAGFEELKMRLVFSGGYPVDGIQYWIH